MSEKKFTPDARERSLAVGFQAYFHSKYGELQDLLRGCYTTSPMAKGDNNFTTNFEANIQAAVAGEQEFVRHVLDALEQWSQENDVVLLWDIDQTLGSTNDWSAPQTPDRSPEWGYRVSAIALLEFISTIFPNMKHGILSSRSKTNIQNNLQPGGQLVAIAHFFTADRIYSTGDIDSDDAHDRCAEALPDERLDTEHYNPDALKRLATVRGLVATGLNAKAVFDSGNFTMPVFSAPAYTHGVVLQPLQAASLRF